MILLPRSTLSDNKIKNDFITTEYTMFASLKASEYQT